MINYCESTKKVDYTTLVAGIHPNDQNIEFFASETLAGIPTVMWIQNGQSKKWRFLPKEFYSLCAEAYLKDEEAVTYFEEQFPSFDLNRRVEIWVYHCFGDLDHSADILSGVLQPSENFRKTQNCPSLNFSYKNITINGKILTKRELAILDLMAEGLPDKAIYPELGVSESHYNTIKRRILEKAGATSKPHLMLIAAKEHIV